MATIIFDYVPTIRIITKIDEDELSLLTGRKQSKSWLEKTIAELKVSAYAIFESYAVNKYSLVALRTAPAPEFAVDICFKIIMYNLYYSYGNRHSIPDAIKEEYERVMKVLESWGSPQIISDEIPEDTVASAGIFYTKTEDDLKFQYEDQDNFFGNDV